MRKYLWIVIAALFVAVPSHAQSLADVSAGYSYFHLGGSSGVNLNGVSGAAGINANDWLSVVGDLGVYHGSPSGVGVTATTYTIGPRFTLRLPETTAPVTPFVQALFGGSHLSASYGGFGGSSNPFAYGFGGGADIGSGRIALRPQFDYFGLRSNGVTDNSVRISVGLVFRVGHK